MKRHRTKGRVNFLIWASCLGFQTQFIRDTIIKGTSTLRGSTIPLGLERLRGRPINLLFARKLLPYVGSCVGPDSFRAKSPSLRSRCRRGLPWSGLLHYVGHVQRSLQVGQYVGPLQGCTVCRCSRLIWYGCRQEEER